VIYQAEGQKMPILGIVGIKPRGEREVLGFCVGERENQKAWGDLMADLKHRGVQQVDLWVNDGNQAMLNVLALQFPAGRRQRCIKHKMEKVLGYVPASQQASIEPERLFEEVKRRSHRMTAAFRTEESCLLMFYTVIRSLKFRRIPMPAEEPGS